MRTPIVLLITMIAAGCASIDQPYPEVWPRPVMVESNTCPAIDGTYLNAGERFRLEQPVSLAYRLHNHAERRDADTMLLSSIASPMTPAADEFQSVNLRLEGRHLRVMATRADGSNLSFVLKARAHCRDSTLLLKSASGFGSVFVASMYESYAIALGRAQDGSLLVRQFESGAAFLLYAPVFGLSESEWFRFPPVAPTSTQSSVPAQ